jgi:hypothetical protein
VVGNSRVKGEERYPGSDEPCKFLQTGHTEDCSFLISYFRLSAAVPPSACISE